MRVKIKQARRLLGQLAPEDANVAQHVVWIMVQFGECCPLRTVFAAACDCCSNSLGHFGTLSPQSRPGSEAGDWDGSMGHGVVSFSAWRLRRMAIEVLGQNLKMA
jgi:hypothetical protein